MLPGPWSTRSADAWLGDSVLEVAVTAGLTLTPEPPSQRLKRPLSLLKPLLPTRLRRIVTATLLFLSRILPSLENPILWISQNRLSHSSVNKIISFSICGPS